MFEIKFTGANFLEVRKEIQEFAINHLNAKFGVDTGYNTAPVAETTATVTSTAHEEVPVKRKPGRQPGFSPKKHAAAKVEMPPEEPATAIYDEQVEVHEEPVMPALGSIPTEEEAMAAIQAVQEKHGTEKAKRIILDEILPTFGVKRGRDLRPEQRRQFILRCEMA